MTRLAGTALLLCALLCGVAAARESHWNRFESALRAGKSDDALMYMRQGMLHKGEEKKKEEGCSIVAVKYDVPPSLHEKFVDEWRKVEEGTMKEEGFTMYDCCKTFNDNVYFWTYGEWDSMDDYMSHYKSDYMTNFLDFLNENDINYHMYPMHNITDNSAMHKKMQRRGGGGDDMREMAAHIMFQYHVPPSKMSDFMNMWTEMAEKTWQEEDNTVYSLRKFATMNHHFVGYGTWETFDGYMDHFTSKHMMKLREFLRENDIMWFADPLKALGTQSEKKKQ